MKKMCILLNYYAIQSLNAQHISYEIKQKFAFHLQMETEKKAAKPTTRRECPGWKINESTENVNVATNEMNYSTERKHTCVCACVLCVQACKQFLVKSLTHS